MHMVTISKDNNVLSFYLQLLRPRIKRVNLRDVIFLLEQEKETRKSSLVYKAHLK